MVAERNEFCLLFVSGGWCKMQTEHYRPITKQHFVLPTKIVSSNDLSKRFGKVTHQLFGVVINLVSVRGVFTKSKG